MRFFIQNLKMQQRFSILFVSAFIAHLLLLHIGMTGYVLCVGDDGHIAIERSLDETTCLDSESVECSVVAEGHSEAYCPFEESHCGDCKDIVFLSDCDNEKARTPRGLHETRLAVPFVAVSLESYPQNISAPRTTGIPEYVYIPSFTAQRNTILLT